LSGGVRGGGLLEHLLSQMIFSSGFFKRTGGISKTTGCSIGQSGTGRSSIQFVRMPDFNSQSESGLSQKARKKENMRTKQFRSSLATITTVAGIIAGPILFHTTRVQAQVDEDDHDSRIEMGFQIAPVPLKIEGKNRALVGFGSYLVNVAAACNDCHSAGLQTQFLPGGNPYFGLTKEINSATYLGGGRDFGPLTTTPGSPHIVSRNLTPDKTGLPEGGRSFAEFREILRTGVDLDHLHPPCSSTQTTTCLPAPFDGNLLQIMPWPTYQSMTERDLRAIYEYLSAIPCIEGPPAPSILHNDCQ
jgi:hypothetical protein